MHKKSIKHYRGPAPLHVRRLHPELVETIRQQNSILDALSCFQGDHADQMRKTAQARRDTAADALNMNLGQPVTPGNTDSGA
jgi:hypothetical protein